MMMALLIMFGLSFYFVSGTYAKYTAQVSGNATATVAKWNFATDNAITSLTINLDETPHASTLAANKIAPGTSGSFAINLKNTNSEVGANFTLSLGEITDKPTNLKFYKNSTYTTEITPGSGTITGQLAAGDSTGITVNIYWRWQYETTNGDAADTADGIAAKSLTLPVTITGTQVAPSATAITSHIN
jgi:hypothetical protein